MTRGLRRTRQRAEEIAGAVLVAFALAGAARAEAPAPIRIPDAQLVPAAFAELEGWAEDDHNAAFAAFLKSCRAILAGTRAAREARPLFGAFFEVCRKAVAAKPQRPGEARAFFEQNFRPLRISPLGETDGFITGYYEPIVEGTREPTEEFTFPLYRKPPSLLPGGRMLAVNFSSQQRKGKNRRAVKRRLVPFYDRAAIENGALAGRNLEICWLKDPIDAFFAHIQGSVRVKLDDGELLRLNYFAQNGHPYVAVGKFLIERNIIPRDEMSMDRIRQWMEANPEEGRQLRLKNKSYVFFRETNLAPDEEPTGAQGVSLTPGRSIAVDRNLHVYGTPFFVSAELPIETEQPTTPFRRLMIAQDTGGAIIGPARADIYFGAGEETGSIAGRLRHSGRFVMLVPNAVDPSGAGADVPLPRAKPAVVETAKPRKYSPIKAAAAAKAKQRASAPVNNKPKHKRKRKHRRRRWAGGG
jgi:membrane-bound lytic murein transglycosylase A